MTALAKVYVSVAALVAVLVTLALWRADVRREALKDAALGSLEQRVQNLAAVAAIVDTQLVHDTVRFTKIEQHYDSAKSVVETKWLHDTVPVPVEVVKTIVQEADSTIRFCKVTLSECAKEVVLQKNIVANRDSAIDILKSQKPSLLSRCGIGAGYGVVLNGGKMLAGPSAVASCKLWP